MANAETQDVDTSGQVDATDTTANDLVDDRTLGDDWDDGESLTDTDDDDLGSEDGDDSAATDDTDTDDSEDDTDVDESTEETETTEDSEDTEDSDSEDDSDTTDEPSDRKRRNDAAAKARIEAKRAREAEAEARAETDRLRIQREEERLQQFLDEAGDDEVERKNREIAVKEHRLQEREINMNRSVLQVGIERAVASIDTFRTGTDIQKSALADSLDDFEARYVEKDNQGRPVAIRIDPATGKPADVVSYLQRKDESIRKLAGEGVKKQAKSKSREKARTMATPRRAPVKAKADPLLDGFDEEAGRW